VGLGDVHNERNLHNTACRYRNWQPDDVHGARSVARDQLQLPADRIPWNAERQCGLWQSLEHCFGFNDGRATATTATTATTAATAAATTTTTRQ
jgi:hypothetical protein